MTWNTFEQGGAQEEKANCNIMNVGGGCLCKLYSWGGYIEEGNKNSVMMVHSWCSSKVGVSESIPEITHGELSCRGHSVCSQQSGQRKRRKHWNSWRSQRLPSGLQGDGRWNWSPGGAGLTGSLWEAETWRWRPGSGQKLPLEQEVEHDEWKPHLLLGK